MADSELAERAFRYGIARLGIPTRGGDPEPVDLYQARRAFRNAVDIDDGMCDAWLGLAQVTAMENQGTAAVVDRDVIHHCYRTRSRLGESQRHLGLAHSLCGLYPTGLLNLSMRTRDDVCLARAALLAEDANYDDALALINDVKNNSERSSHTRQLGDYLLGTLYTRTERWPDALAALNAHEWVETAVRQCADYMAGTACAHLGMFTEAARRLDAVTPELPTAYNRALLQRAFVARELGDEDHARALFEALRAHRGDPDLVREAARALSDPTARIAITTDELINARTNMWDPTTTPALATTITEDRRAILLKEANDQLAELIGLDSVKDSIEDLQANVRISGKLREKGRPTAQLTEHVLLSGPPGVGKTVVARILAKIFAGYGAVDTDKFVEATEETLVSKYVAATREQTAKVIDSAQGGVLFIDEIYTLVKESREHNHGKEAIEGLLHRLENDRDSFVCIVAGYDEDINRFLRTNTGLKSRFTQRIRFRSYTPDELVKIADVLAPKAGAELTDEARQELSKTFAELCAQTDPATGKPQIDILGNARFVRQVVKTCVTARNRRLINSGVDLDLIDEHLELLADDVTRGVRKAVEAAAEESQMDFDET